MKNSKFRILSIITIAFILSLFIYYYSEVDYRLFFFLFLLLLCFGIILPLQNIIIFIIISFSFLVFFHPVVSSLFVTFFPTYHFSANILIAIILILFFLKICTKSQLNSKAISFISFAIIIFYFSFKRYIQYEPFFGIILIFLISSLFLLLMWDGTLILEKGLLTTSILSLCCCICILLFQNYIRKDKMLNVGLIESKWGITTGNYTDDYSMKSSYSYSLMKEIIQNKHKLFWIKHYSQLETQIDSLDVLFVMTPVKPFSAKEIAFIENFISQGGSLVAIADHTDLYGHATVLNELLRPYGVKINNVSLFKTEYSQTLLHVKGMKFDKIRIKTPSSLSLFRPSYVWAWANQWISEKGDYSKPNFFGNLRWTTDDFLGNWPAGATIKHHRGQVTVFCDSTIFANFAIFQPNNLNLLYNILYGNRFASHASFYGSILVLILLVVIFLNKLPYSSLQLFSILLIFLSSSYYEHSNRGESINLKNILDVYCDQNIIFEYQPNRIPGSTQFSSPYSHGK